QRSKVPSRVEGKCDGNNQSPNIGESRVDVIRCLQSKVYKCIVADCKWRFRTESPAQLQMHNLTYHAGIVENILKDKLKLGKRKRKLWPSDKQNESQSTLQMMHGDSMLNLQDPKQSMQGDSMHSMQDPKQSMQGDPKQSMQDPKQSMQGDPMQNMQD
ncbi:unnamed protein product, partial [Owenia fusiformis]